ncbi:MAG: NUDIX domain-containing protein [Flavobacteriaceae bacterium]|nr:NUDIX domain-containing protein [Flavobacteriaceae bacterium]
MYKVFINEKKLSINNVSTRAEKNIIYDGFNSIEIALDLLENTSCKEVNILGEKPDEIWEDFQDSFTNVEAAGGIVENKNGDFLFIFRLGKWDLPKGKLESNESIENTAVREVEEETGIQNLELKNFVDTTYHIYKDKKNNAPMLKITYWYLMKYNGNETPKPQTEEGITKAEWKNKENISSEVLPNTFRNIQLILEKAKII